MMSAVTIISIRDQGALDLVRTLLQEGTSVRIRVSGESMRPLLSSGDVVEISSMQGKYPKPGDVVLFQTLQGTPLVHRLLQRRYCSTILYLQTKGDACRSFDSFVPADHILGRVQRIITCRGNLDLHSPVMRLQSFRIVVCTLLSYYLHRAVFSIKGLTLG